MAIYDSVWKMLAWSVTVAFLLPITIPWGVVSYKIWHGNKPIEEELKEQLWWRSFLASIALFAGAVVCASIDFAIVDWFDLPAGIVHFVFLIALLSFASWMLMYFFSLEDFFQGLIMLMIYWYVPTALLFIIQWMVRNPLFDHVKTWLIEPKA